MTDLRTGDCLQVMPSLPENSVDSIITDPPYGLDFMGKEWDHGVPGVEFWQAALRVAKPGAMLLAFGGTRTFHRLACAIEDAGWELRDTMCWLYGSGFPKSLDISKAIDKAVGAEREAVGIAGKSGSTRHCMNGDFAGGEYMDTAPATDAAKLWSGYGTALKPAWEPIIVAMKPLDGTFAENAQKWGVAGLNIDGGRIAGGDWDSDAVLGKYRGSNVGKGTSVVNSFGVGEIKCTNPNSTLKGRWPANLLLDEDSARLLDEQSGERPAGIAVRHNSGGNTFGGDRPKPTMADMTYADHGGASRFFYTAKASSSERNAGLEDMPEAAPSYKDYRPNCETTHGIETPFAGTNRGGHSQNTHPTVKPVALMRYLCKLTRTPTGGVVLDPFMGSGTTGIACVMEHRDFIGIELNAEYAEIARKRIADMEGPLFEEAA